MSPIGSLLISVAFLLPISIFSLSECNFTTVFNFGDSNSDTGGFTAMYGHVNWPNGETYFGYSAGRLCDGRLIIDFMAQDLGIPLLSAYLDSMGTNFSNGANFATAGSTIRRQNTTIFQSGYSPIPFDIAYKEYTDFFNKSQIIRQEGDVYKYSFPEEEEFYSGLYTIDIGQNDLTAGYQLGMSTEEVIVYIPDVLSQFAKIVKKIYAQGGRAFWIHNTGPTGCLPYIMDSYLTENTTVDEYGCATPYNDVAQYFNTELKEVVIQLREELPLAAITYVDIYSVKYSLIAQAEELGFDDPFLTCCGYGGKYNYDSDIKCGAMKMVNGTKIVIAPSCEDPSSRIIWDGTHFTEAANKWIYSQIVDGSFSDPPLPLNMVCNRVENSLKLNFHRKEKSIFLYP